MFGFVKRFLFQPRYVELLESEFVRLEEDNRSLVHKYVKLREKNRALADENARLKASSSQTSADESVKPLEMRVAERMAEGPLVEEVVEDGQSNLRIKDPTAYAIQAQLIRSQIMREHRSFRPGPRIRRRRKIAD